MILEIGGATTDNYDAVNAAMGVDKDHLPEGLISHAVGPTENGLAIVDFWDNAGDMERFVQQQVGPAMQQVGLPSGAQPRVHPVHNLIEKGSGDQANVMLLIDSSTFTPAAYDEIVSRMPAHAGDGSNHPAVSHVAAVSDDGMVFVDLWDSAESAQSFFESQIGPASEGLDVGTIEPRVVPVHNRFAAKS